MVPLRNILAGALALLVSGQAAGQIPSRFSEAELVVIVDSRLGQPAVAALATARTQQTLPFTLMKQTGGCGAPFTRHPLGQQSDIANGSDDDTKPFDLDSALRSAAIADGSEHVAAILLIAKGRSECLSIGCALAASLADQHDGLRIHVLAVSAAAAPLSCLAANTGGQFKQVSAENLPDAIMSLRSRTAGPSASASNASEQPPETARPEPAIDTVPATVLPPTQTAPEIVTPEPAFVADRTGKYPPLPQPRPAPGQKTEADVEAPETAQNTEPKAFQWAALPPTAPEMDAREQPGVPGTVSRILAGPRGPLVKSQLAFEILSPEGDGTFRRVAQSTAPSPFFPLSKGQYVARITHGEVVREYPFAVSGTGVDHHAFSLDLGYLALQARPSPTAAPLESGITYTVYRLNRGTSSKPLLVRADSQPMIALPAGVYRVLAESGHAKAVADLEIAPGATVRHHFDFNFGYLRVTAISDDHDVSLRIGKPPASLNAPVKVLVTHPGNSSLFRLPAGRYIASASAGNAQAQETVAVEQGKLAEIVLQMQTAADEQPPQQ